MVSAAAKLCERRPTSGWRQHLSVVGSRAAAEIMAPIGLGCLRQIGAAGVVHRSATPGMAGWIAGKPEERADGRWCATELRGPERGATNASRRRRRRRRASCAARTTSACVAMCRGRSVVVRRALDGTRNDGWPMGLSRLRPKTFVHCANYAAAAARTFQPHSLPPVCELPESPSTGRPRRRRRFPFRSSCCPPAAADPSVVPGAPSS